MLCMVLSAVKAWEWFLEDEALRSVLNEAKAYVRKQASKGTTSDDMRAHFDQHYEAFRPVVNSIARAYGRTSGKMPGGEVSLYRMATDSLHGYIFLLRVDEAQRKFHTPAMC